MTTIAFDGRILAADTAGNWDNVIRRGTETKIIVYDRALCAIVGAGPDARVLADWVARGLKKGAPDHLSDDIGVLKFERDRVPLWFNSNGHGTSIPVPFANGSGRDVALGALYAGATAVEAVRIACELDPNTSGPIDYVLVAAEPWVIRQAPEHRDIAAVRRDEDGLADVRVPGRANGGIAPHHQHEVVS